MNRLLINMTNKIEVINGAINMIYELQKGNEIKLSGLHNLTVTSGKVTNDEFNKRLCDLFEEREKLQIRVSYFK